MALQHLSVGEIAVILPAATAIFRRHKIDFCCKGEALFASEAERCGLDPAAIEAEFYALERPGVHAPSDALELIAHIIERYHKTHRIEFPPLVEMARRVEAAHRDRADCPRGLAELLSSLFEDLEDHQHREEAVLFPAIIAGTGPVLRDPIRRMMREHQELGELLASIADLTDDFVTPDGACSTWRALYAGCGKLDADLREHVHLENNILFRRFL